MASPPLPPLPPPAVLVYRRTDVQKKKKNDDNNDREQHSSTQQQMPTTSRKRRAHHHQHSREEDDDKSQPKHQQQKNTYSINKNSNKKSTTSAVKKTSWTIGQCINVSERYEKVKRLGQGTYGVVYQARDLHFQQKQQKSGNLIGQSKNNSNNNINNNNNNNNMVVALKRCIPHHQANDGFPITTLREIHALKLCKHHKHIVHLHHIAVSRNGVFLVLEYCEHDMAQLIDDYYQIYQTSPFRPEHIKTLLQQLLSAMDHVHTYCSLIHRDVKLSNLLYNESNGYLKLCDFGLARIYSHDYYLYSSSSSSANNVLNNNDGDNNNNSNNNSQHHQHHNLRLLTPNVVSLWYRPPELLLGAGSSYTQGIDMWAVGCVMAELVLGHPLLNGTTELQQVEQIFDIIGVPTTIAPTTGHITTTTTTTSANKDSSSSYFNLMDLPLIRNGQVQVPRKSRRRLLTLLGDELTPAAMKILTQLLHLNHVQRWTAYQALTLTTYFTTELPLAAATGANNKMPRFSNV